MDYVFLEVLNEPSTKDAETWNRQNEAPGVYKGHLQLLRAMHQSAPNFTLIADANQILSSDNYEWWIKCCT